MTCHLSYRPDIDGLRAIAVGLVLGFHAFPSTFRSGFIGVDIFFVISGYLIAGIIINDLKSQAFTFSHFYKRRIIRIFPALIIVLSSCLIAGFFLLLPNEFAALGKHILAGSMFSENIILWQEVGYFDVAARAKPLLNLWSLGIEEQFYLFLPFLIWFFFIHRVRIVFVIIICAILSFWDNIWLTSINQTAQFYSPLSRMWELLSGSIFFCISSTSLYRHLYNKFDIVCSSIIFVDNNSRGGGG